MVATSQHNATCNSYNTNCTYITRNVHTTIIICGILLSATRGGDHDHNGRRFTTQSGGGCKETQGYNLHGAKVYQSRKFTRGQGWRTLEGQAECPGSIYQQKQYGRQKLKAAYSRRPLKTLAVTHFSSDDWNPVDEKVVSHCLFPDSTLLAVQKSRASYQAYRRWLEGML